MSIHVLPILFITTQRVKNTFRKGKKGSTLRTYKHNCAAAASAGHGISEQFLFGDKQSYEISGLENT